MKAKIIELSAEFKPQAEEEIRKKGWFLERLGLFFLDKILPILFTLITNEFILVRRQKLNEK